MERHGPTRGSPRPPGWRMPLVASLPGCIVLLVGFVVGFLLGVRMIGLVETVIVWCVVFGLVAAGVAVMLRVKKR